LESLQRTYHSDDVPDITGIEFDLHYVNGNSFPAKEIPRFYEYWDFSKPQDEAEDNRYYLTVGIPVPEKSWDGGLRGDGADDSGRDWQTDTFTYKNLTWRAWLDLKLDKIYFVDKITFSEPLKFLDDLFFIENNIMVGDTDRFGAPMPRYIWGKNWHQKGKGTENYGSAWYDDGSLDRSAPRKGVRRNGEYRYDDASMAMFAAIGLGGAAADDYYSTSDLPYWHSQWWGAQYSNGNTFNYDNSFWGARYSPVSKWYFEQIVKQPGLKLNVTYTNGGSPKSYRMEDAIMMRPIQASRSLHHEFAVVKWPNAGDALGENPVLGFRFRGRDWEMPLTIYSDLVKIEAEIDAAHKFYLRDQEGVLPDNVIRKASDINDLASWLTVKVTYQTLGPEPKEKVWTFEKGKYPNGLGRGYGFMPLGTTTRWWVTDRWWDSAKTGWYTTESRRDWRYDLRTDYGKLLEPKLESFKGKPIEDGYVEVPINVYFRQEAIKNPSTLDSKGNKALARTGRTVSTETTAPVIVKAIWDEPQQ
jgi:hypothetical protein